MQTLMFVAILLTLTCASRTFAQPPSAAADLAAWSVEFSENSELPPAFRQLSIPREDGSRLTLFLGNFCNSLNTRKPLLVYLEGSGAQSHFMRLDDGRIAYSTFGLIARNFGDRCHAATVEKRGVDFGDHSTRGTGQGASEEYNEHATLPQRVDDVRLMLDTLLAEANVDEQKVILVGHSEGACVAAAVAADDERISHVAFLSGGGAPQFFDWLIQCRKQAAAEGATPGETEARVAATVERIRAILSDPENQTRFVAGHAYRRWSSFASVAAADNLLKTKARLFLAHGTEDQSVPIESFDYLLIELLRHGRTDATIRRYAGCDHSFIKAGDEPSNEPFQRVIGEVVDWALNSGEAQGRS